MTAPARTLPFPVTFEEHQPTTAASSVEWPGSSEPRHDDPIQSILQLPREDSELVIKALEKRLAALKSRSGSVSGSSPLVHGTSGSEDDSDQEDADPAREEGQRLLRHAAAPGQGQSQRRPSMDLSNGLTTDEDSDGAAVVQHRMPSLRFNEVVRISGGIRRVSRRGKEVPGLSRMPSRQGSSLKSPALSLDGTPSSSRVMSRRPSNVSTSESALSGSLPRSSGFPSRASSPCSSVVSSIFAPLMPVSSSAPSPSRTLRILHARTELGTDRAYKYLIHQQHQAHLAQKPAPRPPSRWRGCFNRGTAERKPLLPTNSDEEDHVKTEIDVRFGTRPRRYLKWRYWVWRWRDWARGCCGETPTEDDSDVV